MSLYEKRKHLIKKKTTPIHDKKCKQSEYRRNKSQHHQSHIQQTCVQHPMEWGKSRNSSTNMQMQRRMSTFTTAIQHISGNFS